MRPLRLLLPVVTIAVTLAALAGCGGGGGPSFKPLELVPQGVNFVTDVQIERIINDADFQKAYNDTPKSGDQPATWNDLLAKFTDETGLDLHQFSDALIFGDLTRASQYFCGIVQGTFNETQFMATVEAKSGEKYTTTTYKGYNLYTDQKGEATLAFLGSTTLLFGSDQAVKDAIDVSKGDRNRLTGQLLDSYNGVGSGMIKAAVQIPESERSKLLNDQGQQGVSLKPFADTDAVALAVDKSGTTESFRIEAHFVSSTSAQDAKDTLSGGISLLKGMTQDQATKDLLGKVQVEVSGSTLRITFSASLSELEKAVPGLTNPLGGIK